MIISWRVGIAVVFIFAFTVNQCHAQWSRLTQADLRSFTEKAISDKIVSVAAPQLDVVRLAPNHKQLQVFIGSYEPRDLSGDPLFDEVLEEQFKGTIIRLYRSQPQMRKNWAPTLNGIEQRIQLMLDVLASQQTKEQKELTIANWQADIEDIYATYFVWTANQRGAKRLGIQGPTCL